MALYAQLDSNNVLESYPLSIFNLRWLYPYVSWPEEPTQDVLTPFNLVIVYETTPPLPAKRNEEVIEVDPVPDENGIWWQVFKIQKINQSLSECKEKEKAYLAQKRWEKETGGYVWNGWPVHTDRETQGKLSALYLMAIGDFWTEFRWKFKDDVSRILTKAQAIEMCLAVGNFVQGCYEQEGVILDAIAAAETDDEAINWTFV